MARPLRGHPMQYILSSSTPPVAFFCLVMAMIFSVVSVVSFLCGSHKNIKPKRSSSSQNESGHKKLISSSNLSSKALMMVKMISWKKIQVEEEDDDDDNEAVVWKKSIIMGERCRPLEFSGKIVYDSQGNLVPDSKSHLKKSGSHVCLGKS